MRENRTSGSEGGEAQTNELSLPLSLTSAVSLFGVRTTEGPPTLRQTGRCKPAKSGSGLCAANPFGRFLGW